MVSCSSPPLSALYLNRSAPAEEASAPAAAGGVEVADDSTADSESASEETTESAEDQVSGESAEARAESADCPKVDPENEEEDSGWRASGLSSECHGILTCTAFVVDQVLAIPFRLLGYVLKVAI